MTEIKNALSGSDIGKLDMIGFDACLMGSIEVAGIVQPYTDYLLASEELEPGHGWEWSSVIKEYVQNQDIVNGAEKIIDSFVQNIHEYESDGKTLSLLDLSKFSSLVTGLDNFSTSYSNNIDADSEYSNSIIYGITNVQDYGKESKENQRITIDLKHFVQLVKSKISDTNTSQIVMHVEQGDVLDIVDHPNQKKYPNQQLLVVEINKYAYLVPFVENENSKFLKTIIPSRKATRYYLGGKNE